MFVAAPTGVTIFQIGDDLSPALVGLYNSTATFGEATSVAYNSVYDELAIAVKSYDDLTKGHLHVVPSVEDWIG